MTTDIADDEAAADPTYAFKPSLIGGDVPVHAQARRAGMADRPAQRPHPLRPGAGGAPVVSAGDDADASLHHRNLVRRQSEDPDRLGVLAQHHGAGAAGQGLFGLHYRVAPADRRRGRTGEVHDRPAACDLLGRRRHLQRRSCSRPAACSCARSSSVQWAPTAVVGIFFLVFAYQLGTYFYRNRPGRYRPDAIPPSVLPKT